MKILITGPTGFIGKHLIDRLLKEGHAIVTIEKDNADLTFLQERKIPTYFYSNEISEIYSVMRKENPDGVVHLASLFLVNHNDDQVTNLINTNILFPSHLIEAASNSNVKWFLNTGTFWQHYESSNYSPVNLYAATKQSFEDIARFYFESRNINFVSLKLSDTFGPGDSRPKIFNLWMKNAFSNDFLEMTPGNQLIDISYIDNVIDGYASLINLISKDNNKQLCGKCFAIKADKLLTLRELAAIFQQETGLKLNIKWGNRHYKQREVMVPWQNGEVIPNWKPIISLEEGIRRYFISINQDCI